MSEKIESLLEKANSDNENENSVSFAKRIFSDSDEAERIFTILKEEILDIKEWNRCATISSYKLFDENGEVHPNQRLAEGVLNRVLMKGSGKYDWVRVTEIYESENEKIITVKPTADQTAKTGEWRQTSHFFTHESSNNFCLLRHEQTISFYVIGLREKQNTSETDSVIETIRNVAVANIGSYFGIQKAEWETFCKNFLDSEN